MIVLLESIHADAVERLAATGHEVVFIGDSAVFDPEIPGDDVVAIVTRGRGKIGRELLDSLPNLRAIGRCGVGLDNIDVAAAHERGVAVGFAPGTLTDAVAESALMLQLAAARDLIRLANESRADNWQVRNEYEGYELRGKRLGVVGLGAIGARIAAFGRCLGMDVVGWSRSSTTADARSVELDELLSSADVIQLCVPLNDDTAGMLDGGRIAQLKPGVIIVNTARGRLIDPAAMLAALDTGRVAAYAADVWHDEPPQADDPLLHHHRVIVTPHAAVLTDATYRRMCVKAADAVACVIEGREPEAGSLVG